MNEEMFNKLLAKLETVGGRGWELLVEAEFYSGAYRLILSVAFLSAACVLGKKFIAVHRYNCTVDVLKQRFEAAVVLGALALLCVVFGLMFSTGITSVLAPEAMALRGLLK